MSKSSNRRAHHCLVWKYSIGTEELFVQRSLFVKIYSIYNTAATVALPNEAVYMDGGANEYMHVCEDDLVKLWPTVYNPIQNLLLMSMVCGGSEI
jgi:hypothetical protein